MSPEELREVLNNITSQQSSNMDKLVQTFTDALSKLPGQPAKPSAETLRAEIKEAVEAFSDILNGLNLIP